MYKKHQITLWTDEMVFVRGAIHEQLERYSRNWRKTFINVDADIAAVYLPAIRACQSALKEFDKVMPPK